MITSVYEDGIFKVTFKDYITLDDILDFLIDFSKIEYLRNDVLLLYDLENASIAFDPSEINIISKSAECATKKYTSIKTAFLANDPKLNAYSTLFSNHSKETKTVRKIFSTAAAALNWLKQKEK
jgi:hypothetical protein